MRTSKCSQQTSGYIHQLRLLQLYGALLVLRCLWRVQSCAVWHRVVRPKFISVLEENQRVSQANVRDTASSDISCCLCFSDILLSVVSLPAIFLSIDCSSSPETNKMPYNYYHVCTMWILTGFGLKTTFIGHFDTERDYTSHIYTTWLHFTDMQHVTALHRYTAHDYTHRYTARNYTS
jgi:hypothetical protein